MQSHFGFWLTPEKTPSGINQLGEFSYQGASTCLNVLGFWLVIRTIYITAFILGVFG
ncbi:MAG TPA: hypothetical protein VK203_09020 [Nostocaceae cyanobacterium]|nr:hypothetical protein [Nostocaceae cyanobacterium]